MSHKKQLAKNTFYIMLDWALMIATSLFFWVIVGKFFAPNEYGVAASIVQLATFISIAGTFGTHIALGKLLPEFNEKLRKRKLIHTFLSHSIKETLLLSLLISSVAVTIIHFHNFLKLKPLDLLLFLPLPISLSLYTISWYYLYGLQQMKKLLITDSFGFALKIALLTLLSLTGFRAIAVITSIAVAHTLIFLSRINIAKISSKPLTSSQRSLLKHYSLPAFIISVLDQAFNNTHFLILSALTTTALAGIFAVSFKVSYFLFTIPFAISQALFPITSKLSSSSKRSEKSELLTISLKYAFAISLPLLVLILAFGDYIILLFASKPYLAATNYLPLLLPASLAMGLSQIILYSFYASKQPKQHRNLYLIAAAIFMTTSIPLTILLKGYGMSVAYLLTSTTLFILTLMKSEGMFSISLSLGDVAKPVLATLLAFPILFVRFLFHGFLLALIITLLYTTSYFIILLLIKFPNKDELKMLKSLAKKLPLLLKRFHGA